MLMNMIVSPTCLRRDVQAWQNSLLAQGLAHSTINKHLASLSAFTIWAHAHDPDLFPAGDPAKGAGELGLSPLEPRALCPEQVRSLKNLCDRLDHFHFVKGRRRRKQEKEQFFWDGEGRPRGCVLPKYTPEFAQLHKCLSGLWKHIPQLVMRGLPIFRK